MSEPTELSMEMEMRIQALPPFFKDKFIAATQGPNVFRYKVGDYDYASPEVQLPVFETAKAIAEKFKSAEEVKTAWHNMSIFDLWKIVPQMNQMSAYNLGIAIKTAIKYLEMQSQ